MSTSTSRNRSPELAQLRRKLASARGKRYWRSLEEIAETPEFLDYLHREFPEQASEMTDPVSRRRFLQLMGASLGLAGATACTGQAPELIVPFVRQPEDLVPGKPLYYASSMTLGGYATGLLVETHMGRPTKIEGNPEHPASLGSTDSFAQAEVLNLYDPDRSQVVLRNGRITTWEAFLAAFTTSASTMAASGGAGLRILTETITSPTLADQIERVLTRFPGAQWHQFEPAVRDSAYLGSMQAFGEPVETVYGFGAAERVVTLDAEIFAGLPGCIRYTREFSARRRVRGDGQGMSRLYALESSPTLTGVRADHCWRLRSSSIEVLARALAAMLGVSGLDQADAAVAAFEALDSGVDRQWLEALAADLTAHSGRSVVVPGESQPPVLHALAHAINRHLDNVGTTVRYTDPVAARSVDQVASIRELAQEMNAGDVELLVIVGGNPVFNAPADLDFLAAMQRVPRRVHLGPYEDETSEQCHWHVPEAHFLESWGDARAYDGTVTLAQPTIEPLYGGRSATELMAILIDQPERDSREIVRAYWGARWEAGEADRGLGLTFDTFWQRVLHDGLIAGTAFETREVTLAASWDPGVSGSPARGLEVLFRLDATVYDGRFANNGWLQETPKPITKLTWDNAALVSPTTAEHEGLSSGDIVELSADGRSVQLPVWITPGHVDDAVTVTLGYGRRRTGRVGTETGFDVYPLRTGDAMWTLPGATIDPTGAHYPLASTQLHHSMEGRDLVRVGTYQQYRDSGEIPHPHTHVPGPQESLFPPFAYEGLSWGMAIDLNLCIGCNGCMTACQAENNIPVVGKRQVLVGREMHWIRVDRYYAGELDDPETVFQPVTCMHCENAPCELVCPVAATVHGSEGLNEMIYNRCVGTRYCANNCPYKVRRFNFFDYTDTSADPVLAMVHNPDVTVRSRGVMEKCTYCVQRINRVRQDAKVEGREIQDGDVVTACQQACPAEAITFGNINDPDSAISAARQDPLHYGILVETGTRPRTNYLARLDNPNPAIADRPDHGVTESSDGH